MEYNAFQSMREREIIMRKAAALGKSFLWCICILLFPILSGTISAVLSLGTVETLLLQGMCMLLSLAIPLAFVLGKKWNWKELGFGQADWNGCKKAIYFLPLAAILIPAAVKGFRAESAAYVWGNLFLYFSVGAAEEVYFRGIIPNELSRAFSGRGVVLLSAAVFGAGHIAAAFTADSGLEICLTVLNAFIFGWLAVEMRLICKNITPIILLHFLFDFETKIVVMSGRELLAAECVRGALMVIAAVWLAVILARGKQDSRLENERQESV